MCIYSTIIFTVLLPLKEDSSDQESRMFPDDGKTDVITCSTLTQDFLIFGTEVSWDVICSPACLSITCIL